jgi:hypothetical protein
MLMMRRVMACNREVERVAMLQPKSRNKGMICCENHFNDTDIRPGRKKIHEEITGLAIFGDRAWCRGIKKNGDGNGKAEGARHSFSGIAYAYYIPFFTLV